MAIQRLLSERPLTTLSATLVLGAVTLMWMQNSGGNKTDSPPDPLTSAVRASAPYAASPPTLAAYRRAVEISIESLDTLLAKEAARNTTVMESVTLASLLAPSSEK